VVNALFRRYVFLSTLNVELLEFKHVKNLYTDDSGFANVYDACEMSVY